jgi:hypothetical protein
MSVPSTQPRVLFVTPEAAFIQEGTENRPNFTSVGTKASGVQVIPYQKPRSTAHMHSPTSRSQPLPWHPFE